MLRTIIDWACGRSEWSIHGSFQRWCPRHRRWHYVNCHECFNELLVLIESGLTLYQAQDIIGERNAEHKLGEDYFA